MTLIDYWNTLTEAEKREYERKSGLTNRSMYHFVNGLREPKSLELCLRLVVASGYKVKLTRLYPSLFSRKTKVGRDNLKALQG